MKLSREEQETLAKKVVQAFFRDLYKSTWREKYPEAYEELKDFNRDIQGTIEKELRS